MQQEQSGPICMWKGFGTPCFFAKRSPKLDILAATINPIRTVVKSNFNYNAYLRDEKSDSLLVPVTLTAAHLEKLQCVLIASVSNLLHRQLFAPRKYFRNLYYVTGLLATLH